MLKVDPGHHLLRFVKSSFIIRHPETDEIISILPDAYHLKNGEQDLSMTWIEYYDPRLGDQQTVAEINCGIKLTKRTRWAVHTEADFRSVCSRHSENIRVLHDPDPPNDAHVSIKRYPVSASAMFAELAATAEVRPYKTVACT